MDTNTNSLFSNNENDSNNQNELTGEDSLKLLVGEGCKYATVEELAKGMVHGQTHITKLEGEATTLRDLQTKQTSIDDILKAVRDAGSTNQQQEDNQQQTDQSTTDSGEKVSITQQIEDALATHDRGNQAAANVKRVTDSLVKVLGSRTNEVYTKVGNELGVNLDELAKTSPDAVIKLCTGQGQTAQQQGGLPPSTFTHVTPTGGDALDYKGIQVLYAAGGMSREKKFELEQSQALKLGSTFFNK